MEQELNDSLTAFEASRDELLARTGTVTTVITDLNTLLNDLFIQLQALEANNPGTMDLSDEITRVNNGVTSLGVISAAFDSAVALIPVPTPPPVV